MGEPLWLALALVVGTVAILGMERDMVAVRRRFRW